MGIIIAFAVGFYFGVAIMCMMFVSKRGDETMKRVGIAVLAVAILAFSLPAMAGEKEELVLKQQLLQEKIARYEIQFQLLRIQFRDATAELEVLNKRLVEIEKKEEPAKKPEAPKKEEKKN